MDTTDDTIVKLKEWASTLPDPPPQHPLTDEEKKFLAEFDISVAEGRPYVYPEDVN